MFPEGKQGVNPRAVLQYVIRVKNCEGFIYTAQILAAGSRGGRSFAAEGCTKEELCNKVLLEESVLCCLWSALPSVKFLSNFHLIKNENRVCVQGLRGGLCAGCP